MKNPKRLAMKDEKGIPISREKHLDHMVKVVPFIVCAYAIQSFIIYRMGPGEFSTISLSILGGFMALMISSFIFYDLNHQVSLNENELTIKFWGKTKALKYEDIWEIEIKDPGQNFSSLILITASGKYAFHFIDDAEKIKKLIESKKNIQLKTAA